MQKDTNFIIKAFLFLDKNYASFKLSATERIEASGKLEALITAKHRIAPNPPNFKKAAVAFEALEQPTLKGRYASEEVFSLLMRQHAQYNDLYLSPYTTIVGPSGIGKSFSIKQLATRYGVYVVYSCLAPKNSRGFPRPVTMGTAPVDGEQDDMIAQWMLYLRNQLLIADCCKSAGITAPGLFNLLTSDSEEIIAARQKLRALFHNQNEVSATAIHEELLVARVVLEKWDLNSTPTIPQEDARHPVIICFDEARALLDGLDNWAFRSLRQAAKKMIQDSEDSARKEGRKERKDAGHREDRETVSFFMVLLDTTSKISDFTPPSRYDHSAKVTNQRIFRPIFQIDSLDTFAPEAISDPSGEESAVNSLFCFGRPLWGAFLKAGHSWDSILNLAIDKISGYEGQTVCNIAMLSFRMNFYISSIILAKDLVASMMRCLVSVSVDRNDIITTQPSEPVLAFAASKLLQQAPTRLACIRSWIGGLHSGALNPGDIGEQVASMILLFAFDYVEFGVATEQDITPHAVPLREFLAALLGSRACDDLWRYHADTTTGNLLKDGAVFFNHIVRASTVPTYEVLEHAYKRGAAVFLPTNFPGMDVAIPIRASEEGPMALLFIQIKNRKGDSNTPGLRLSMKEDLCKAIARLKLQKLHSVIGLVMCLRTPGNSQFVAIEPESGSDIPGPLTRSAARAKGKGTKKGMGKAVEVVEGPEQQPDSLLLGISFGLDSTVYPCLKAPTGSKLSKLSKNRKRSAILSGEASSRQGLAEMEEICHLLGGLLGTWPNAYAEEDTESRYAKRLLDPFFDLHGDEGDIEEEG
ncbi:hypothetical protein CMQ_6702 [Grosmannia clavigera kw1407]|uniref:Uncharacterized protein n=1 Tax=Grosmannia clavigera (strain kw1407 / UAMH 11150) TaxID=655863 RepID=F0X6Y8_GROCL|nr:uncharacterized protein CMQ_6702 [Grosmannia clavigera kw1407]EFX06381.1 hypothetical protein CMQ_6702 [Grosmannia clavigera kw1407]